MKRTLLKVFAATATLTLSVGTGIAQSPTEAFRNVHRSLTKGGIVMPIHTRTSDRPQFPYPGSNSLAGTANKSSAKLMKVAPKKTADANLPSNLFAHMSYSSEWDFDNDISGLYYLDSNPPSLITHATSGMSYGGVVAGNYYWGIRIDYTDYYNPKYYNIAVDLTTMDKVYEELATSTDQIMTAGAVAPDGTVYGITFNVDGDGLQLSKLTYDISANPVVTKVVDLKRTQLNALYIDKDNNFYAVGASYSGDDEARFLKIDPNTGDVSEIGTTGVKSNYYSSGTMVDGRIIWASYYSDYEAGIYESALYEINKETGLSTKLYDYATYPELIGFGLLPMQVAEGAPSAPEKLSAKWDSATDVVTVSFTIPDTSYDGQLLSGDVSYDIKCDDDSVKTGTSSCGEEVSVDLTLEKGAHVITVVLSNDKGDGPAGRAGVAVGNDIPKPVTDIKAEYTNGKVTISWKPSSEGMTGLYINPDEVTYKIVRISPDEKIIAEATKATTVEDIFEDPYNITIYKYSVIASFADNDSEATETEPIAVGKYTQLPYNVNFNSKEDILGYNFIINDSYASWYWNDMRSALSTYWEKKGTADNYAAPPVLPLKAGKAYKLSLNVYPSFYDNPAKIEVKGGNAFTDEDLTETLIEPTFITDFEYMTTLTGYIATDIDTDYYVALHSLPSTGSYFLHVDSFSIEECGNAKAPAEVYDVKAIDPDGTKNIIISFFAPDEDFMGEPVAKLTKIEIYRDDEEEPFKTLTDVEAGKKYELTDSDQPVGYHYYHIYAYNEFGRGKESVTRAFSGVNVPGVTANIRIEENSDGVVTATWDPITIDRDGNPLDPSKVKYNIYPNKLNNSPLVTNCSETTATFKAVSDGDQQFIEFIVCGVTEGGMGEGTLSEYLPIGTPTHGFYDSFPDVTVSTLIGTNIPGAWTITDDVTEQGLLTAADGDNGFLNSMGVAGMEMDLYTGKISLAGIENPMVSFYRYSFAEDVYPDPDRIQVFIREPGGEYTMLYDKSGTETGELGWHHEKISLENYKDKTVQVMWRALFDSYGSVYLDALKVGSDAQNDMGVYSILAPAMAKPNEEFEITVELQNNGENRAKNVLLEVFADGNQIGSKKYSGLSVGTNVTNTFKATMPALKETPLEITANVSFSEDEIESNNSQTVSVLPIESGLPATTLAGESDNNVAKLTWNAPQLEGTIPVATYEDFESGTSWADEFKDWTFLDLDGGTVSGYRDIEIPGFKSGEDKSRFFIFDKSDEDMPFSDDPDYTFRSGNKVLAAFGNYKENVKLDDWAISPLLSGEEQTVAFWARSYHRWYPETIELFYTDKESTDPADYILADRYTKLSYEWKQYTLPLPEGTKHFAIRTCASNGFILFVDDACFRVNQDAATLNVLGYDIYRDGEKINSEPVAATSYTDTLADNFDHEYRIKVVYANGESAGSNAVTLSTSGVQSINGDITIAGAKGCILVKGATGQQLAISTADGKLIRSTVAEGNVRTEVPAGVYIVRAGNTTAKVLVK